MADSWIFSKSRILWENNQKNYDLHLSKFNKFSVGTYLILKDYSTGLFPPKFSDRNSVYEAESKYQDIIPGCTPAEITVSEMRKPFWYGDSGIGFLSGFNDIVRFFQRAGIRPPEKILELGCGYGWMSEFLAIMGFDVMGTSIAPKQIASACDRIRSIKNKGFEPTLEFKVASMESVYEKVKEKAPFDAVFVFEALHHSYNKVEALESGFQCLRPGGWLLIANEPNLIHTYVAYRAAKIVNTHEVGLSRSELVGNLRSIGYTNISIIKNRFSFLIRPIWIAAQRPQ